MRLQEFVNAVKKKEKKRQRQKKKKHDSKQQQQQQQQEEEEDGNKAWRIQVSCVSLSNSLAGCYCGISTIRSTRSTRSLPLPSPFPLCPSVTNEREGGKDDSFPFPVSVNRFFNANVCR